MTTTVYALRETRVNGNTYQRGDLIKPVDIMAMGEFRVEQCLRSRILTVTDPLGRTEKRLSTSRRVRVVDQGSTE